MTLTLEITPELEATLRETAARVGVSPDRYILDLLAAQFRRSVTPEANGDSQPAAPATPLWQRLATLANQVPDEEFIGRPNDIAEQHDHYVYGTPKRD